MTTSTVVEQARRIERLEKENQRLREEATAREEQLYAELCDLLDQLDILVAAWGGAEKASRETADRAGPLTTPTWMASVGTLRSCGDSIRELVRDHEVRPNQSGPVKHGAFFGGTRI